MSRRWLLAALALLMVTGCSALGVGDGARHADLRFMVPNAPGGGYDTTARICAQVLEQEGLTDRIEIFNVEGASGVVGLARTVNERGNADLMMMMGLGVVGAVYANDSTADLDEVTPIARLLSEPEVVLVPRRSRFHTLTDLLRAWRAHPDRITVGGGSSPGGPDFLAPHLIATAVGIDPAAVDYNRYDGGGPLLAALLGGEVDFAVSGVGESAEQVRTGQVRVLAVTSKERIPDFDAPTLQEQGVDLEFVNWRGLVAPPGISDQERRSLTRLVVAMHDSPAWQRAARAYGWDDTFLTGRRFATFLHQESDRVASVMSELGVRP
ncbi:MAG TPA: tripartite tricarboxylate transporter substrate binding protein [Nocardioidaceae bacterium]|nr:tripartite tricarboxylate transporter substrate binding protein [Nocardioidaceae bacterium]